jgi:hypothetical protein
MTITATGEGYRSPIKLPQRSSVYDVFGGKIVARNVIAFQADVPPLTTLLYYIGSEAQMKQFAERLRNK